MTFAEYVEKYPIVTPVLFQALVHLDKRLPCPECLCSACPIRDLTPLILT